ncbi:MAG: ribonuclease P protein component [Candidatus Parcubacteria bacterium]|nr:ribonuclease P protein component [Candidatus Parcubacteria bacterium]
MLKKINRLNKTKDIQDIMKSGKPFYAPLLMLKVRPNQLNNNRLTVVVSAKVSKKAVNRNLIKRRIREAARALWPGTKCGWDAVILASPKMISSPGKVTSYDNIKENLRMVFKKSGIL